MSCIIGAKYNMKADILRQDLKYVENDNGVGGTWEQYQDPDTFEIKRRWKKADNPNTPQDESQGSVETFRCMARGVIDGGIRVAGTTERFGDTYDAVDFVRIWFPTNVILKRRDRITNIRTQNDVVMWLEEDRSDNAATVFSVNGVSPVVDPFGNHVENLALLERSEDQ